MPSKTAAETLRRFSEELVALTPGSGNFPATIIAGDKRLTPPGPYRIAACETTQELYQLVTGRNPSRWKGPRNSVESLTFADAQKFCLELTQLLQGAQLIEASERVRLPTDIEWEYACRAGSTEAFCFGGLAEARQLLDDYAWHTGNAAGNDPAVGVLKPNNYGLFDVHGYLQEFVITTSAEQPQEGKEGPVVCAMGGSWRDAARQLTCSSRSTRTAAAVSDALGFRCVVASEPAGPGKTGSQ